MSRTRIQSSIMVPLWTVDSAHIAGMLGSDGRIICRDACRFFPLQRQRSSSDVRGGVPVGIAAEAALPAPERRSVPVLLRDMPAPRARPRSVPRRDDDHRDARPKGHLFERRSKLVVGQPLHDAVRRPVQPGVPEMVQVLDGDGHGMRHRVVDDTVGDLERPRLVEVGFVASETVERPFGLPGTKVGAALERLSPVEDVLLLHRNILSEVVLSEDTSVGHGRYGSEASASDVDAEHGVLGGEGQDLASDDEGGGPLPVTERDPELRALPVVVEERLEPVPCAVLLDGDGEACAIGPDADDGIPTTSISEASTSRNVECTGDAADAGAVVFASHPGIGYRVDGELGWEAKAPPERRVDDLVEISPGQRVVSEAIPVFDDVAAMVDRADVSFSQGTEPSFLRTTRNEQSDFDGSDNGWHLGGFSMLPPPIYLTLHFLPPLKWGVSVEDES